MATHKQQNTEAIQNSCSAAGASIVSDGLGVFHGGPAVCVKVL